MMLIGATSTWPRQQGRASMTTVFCRSNLFPQWFSTIVLPLFFCSQNRMHEDACRVGCDSCGLYPIKGNRYSCQDCPDRVGFDLCGKCYDRGLHITGRFNQQHTPGVTRYHLSCPHPSCCSQSDNHHPCKRATQQHVHCVEAGRAIAMHVIVSVSTCASPVFNQHVLARLLRCAPVLLGQAKDACVACFAEHKMGLVNPQPTVFHIFQVRTISARFACLQPPALSHTYWHKRLQAIPGLFGGCLALEQR